MRAKKKLELINNYVEIHKILFACKMSIFKSTNFNETASCFKLLKDVSTLKSNYEKIFEKLHLNDEAYLNLKKELETTLKTYKNTPNSNFDFSFYELKKVKIASDLYNVRLKYNILFW